VLKLAHVPEDQTAAEPHTVAVSRVRRPKRHHKHRYYAFLSYSHKDEELAEWLHSELENFHIPHALQGKLTANGVIPKRLKPIFRDEHELAAADNLTDEIEVALASSQFLIVLCSPHAAKSRWTNAEIDAFKRAHPEGCVLAAIGAGEPFASEMPGREDEECFPPALRQKYDRRGRPTGKRIEPLAADLRDDGDGRRLGLLKLVAGMLGVGLDDLIQRDTARRHRRLAWMTAASLAGMIVTSGLAVTAIQARDAARDQRREAEGLVAFMLGDLRDKLEPIGRLDALDGVGSRVLAYYSKQDKSELSDAALTQRSRGLSLMAEVAHLRGDSATAMRLYREAMSGTAEAVRRRPNDPQQLYEHEQNYFYIAEIARQQGDLAAAEAAYRESGRLARRMAAIEPDNLRWRMEVQYGDANTGIVLFGQRRFAEADRQFRRALSTIEAVVSVEPGRADYQQALSDSLAWLADAQAAEGQLAQAMRQRERQVALLERLIRERNGDVNFRRRIIPAYRAMGGLALAQGDGTSAIRYLQSAVAHADRLIPSEPQNTMWQGLGAAARLTLAEALLASGNIAGATGETQRGCATVQRLIARDHSVVAWRGSARACFGMQAQLALRGGRYQSALEAAQRALRLPGADRSIQGPYEIARLHRLAGDAYRSMRNQNAARSEWTAGLGSLPKGVAERPQEISERAGLLRRLGGSQELPRLTMQLDSMGYKLRT
jgi:tetratricopeptide (TPR) repeat protein